MLTNSGHSDFENRRRGIETYAAWVYYALTVAGGLVMLALAWRIDTPVMRAWAIIAAFALVASSIIWLQATQYVAAGSQLVVARLFLGADWFIALLNTIALFYVELSPAESLTVAYGAIHYWSVVGGAVAVLTALVGLGFLRMASPDRQQNDLAREYRAMMFDVMRQNMRAGQLPDDLREQMVRDAYASIANVVRGVGAETVHASARGNGVRGGAGNGAGDKSPLVGKG